MPTATTVTALLDRHHACHTLRYLAALSVCVVGCRDGWSDSTLTLYYACQCHIVHSQADMHCIKPPRPAGYPNRFGAFTPRPWVSAGKDVTQLANSYLVEYCNSVPEFGKTGEKGGFLSQLDSQQLLTYDNLTVPGAYSDNVSQANSIKRLKVPNTPFSSTYYAESCDVVCYIYIIWRHTIHVQHYDRTCWSVASLIVILTTSSSHLQNQGAISAPLRYRHRL